MISNCALWAAWRYVRRGGYVVMTRSDYGWWPHFAWSQDGTRWLQFHPKRHRRWYGWCLRRGIPLPLFDGEPTPWKGRKA